MSDGAAEPPPVPVVIEALHGDRVSVDVVTIPSESAEPRLMLTLSADTEPPVQMMVALDIPDARRVLKIYEEALRGLYQVSAMQMGLSVADAIGKQDGKPS